MRTPGLDPTLALAVEPLDRDSDGLADEVEIDRGTDPHNPDTDGDGIKDGTEVSLDLDPLHPGDGIMAPVVSPGLLMLLAGIWACLGVWVLRRGA